MMGLLPREHGAYAQLGFPLLTGLIYARGDGGAAAFAVAAIALFLAHEPVAVLSGVRGERLQTELRDPARRRVAILAAAAALALIAATKLAPARAWAGAAIPAGIGLLLLPVLGTRRLKSLPAEVIAAAAFSTSVIPLAVCGPASWRAAGVAAAVWYAAVVPAILSVHAIKANLKRKPEELWTLWATPVAAGTVILTATAGALLLPAWGLDFLAVLPPAGAVLAMALILPHPRHLKRVGWTMVAADSVALALLLIL